jgi:hypothetical protein
MPKREPKAAEVKTTVLLPERLWRAAKIRAATDRTDLRQVIIAALSLYLKAKGA